MIDWTQVALALISLLGTVLTGLFANRAGRAATTAGEHADAARVASLRPPPAQGDRVTPVDGSARVRKAEPSQ